MYSEARYFTMTGVQLDGSPPQIAERAVELQALYQQLFGDTEPGTTRVHVGHVAINDDDALIKKACGAKNGANFSKLWQGDWSGYGSHSEADLALCSMLGFWTCRDSQSVDRLFRRSGLFRPKWDKQHGVQTYGEMTIRKATADSYSPSSIQSAGRRSRRGHQLIPID